MTFEADYDAVLTVKARRDRLDAAIAAMAADSEFTPWCAGWGVCAGSRTLTGFALAVEIGDWHRFTGNTIGAFVGLVPTRALLGPVTGPRARSPRPATPTSAGCWSRPPGTTAPATAGKTMRDRWELAPPAARARGDAGNRRLHHRWNTFSARRKRPVIANVAIARELAGWCWSLAVLED